jgi:hypothetical protein
VYLFLSLLWNNQSLARKCDGQMINFKSDNVFGVSPEIMEALTQVNEGTQCSYSADEYTAQLQKIFSEIFETEVVLFLTTTGTATNSLSLSALVKPYSKKNLLKVQVAWYRLLILLPIKLGGEYF